MYVGYLGPSGSFTHNAALKAFPEASLVSLGTITEVIKSYEEGRVDYAVIPVENSIEGSVHESLIISSTRQTFVLWPRLFNPSSNS